MNRFSPVAGILFVESPLFVYQLFERLQVSVPLPGFYLLKANTAGLLVKVETVSVPLPGFYLLK